MVLVANEDLKNWEAEISFDRGVKSVKAGKSGYSIKTGNKKDFTVKPGGKNKKLRAGQKLEIPITINYAR